MRGWMLIIGVVGLMVLASVVSPSYATIYVLNPEGSGDFPTIQAAVDSSVDGDVIELADGTYTGDGNRDINFFGREITVRSQSGNPELCILKTEGTSEDWHRAFFFANGEGNDARVEGLTIMGGYVSGIE